MWTIRYVNPPSVADQPSCTSSGLNAITMPVPLVCRPPRQVNVCAPVSVTPNEYVSWLCRWYTCCSNRACIASRGWSTARR